MHTAVHRFDKDIHIGASPVIPQQLSTPLAIGQVCGVIREGYLFSGAFVRLTVWVEVVIDVDAINVIALNNIGDDIEGVLTHPWITGIQPLHRAVSTYHFRVCTRDVLWMGFSFGNGWSRPEGIEPCMDLDTCFATLSYEVGQWINARILSLAPRQVF